jgi:hypothetical protein
VSANNGSIGTVDATAAIVAALLTKLLRLRPPLRFEISVSCSDTGSFMMFLLDNFD